MLRREYGDVLGFSVSHTTRAPRHGEVNGVSSVVRFAWLVRLCLCLTRTASMCGQPRGAAGRLQLYDRGGNEGRHCSWGVHRECRSAQELVRCRGLPGVAVWQCGRPADHSGTHWGVGGLLAFCCAQVWHICRSSEER